MQVNNLSKTVLIASAIRLALILSRYSDAIQNRVEVSTPLNSWKRVREGSFLYAAGINPYDGDVYHENPIFLYLTTLLIGHCSQTLPFVYVLLDICTGVLLFLAATKFVKSMFDQQTKDSKTYAAHTEELHMKPADCTNVPLYVAITYLLNPYSILNCVGQTTTVWSNFLLAAYFFALSRRLKLLTCLVLALEVLRNLYPFVLIVPAALMFSERPAGKKTGDVRHSRLDMAVTTLLFAGILGGLYYVSFLIAKDWKFLDSTLGFIIYYRDLQPNIGLFWYFFTEMFEHFRTLFLYTFQINATILYLFPLSLKLKHQPVMLATLLTALIAIFRSYPCVGDIGFYMALLPLWKNCSKFMSHNFVVGATFLVTSVLAPTVWHLWIYANSANANFYFGVTLVFCTAQIFLITDLFFAFIKREFCLTHGLKLKIDGKEAKMALE